MYVHYNLRLKNWTRTKKTVYDPIDSDALDLTEDLVVDDEPDEIDIDELEDIAADLTIPTFENQTQGYHDISQAREDEDDRVTGDWNEFDMHFENEFSDHVPNDAYHQHFNLNHLP